MIVGKRIDAPVDWKHGLEFAYDVLHFFAKRSGSVFGRILSSVNRFVSKSRGLVGIPLGRRSAAGKRNSSSRGTDGVLGCLRGET